MDQIGEYVLVKELGKSPLGRLFLAEHSLLKRRVALKLISPNLRDDKEAMSRLEQEISKLASLDHTNLLRLQSVGFHESSCYLAYDWLSADETPSKTLADFAEASEEELFLFAKQIASALDFIHGFSLAHLGVKASNVLIQTVNGKNTAYLADTGLTSLLTPGAFLLLLLRECAQTLSKDSSEARCFWQSFQALSPEQKKQVHFSPIAADVYAFGVLFYDLLAGFPPEGRFPLISKIRPDLKYDWDSLLLSCLEINSALRPKNLEQALEKIRSKETESRSNAESFTLQIKPGEIQRPQFEEDPGAIFQTENIVVRYQPIEQELRSTEPLSTEMVIISGGFFSRGSNQGGRDENPRHQVQLKPFALDIHPVTNEQFVRFLEVMGGEKDRNNNDMIRLRDSRIKRSGGKLSIESGYAKHPVVGVAWYGAFAYAKWVGKRLPTEAEWEIASFGGAEDAIYPTGHNIERSQANFFSSDTTAVMSYPPNGYSLYDMAGNVYEWCNDWYDYHYYNVSVQEPFNPMGPMQGVYRILRGGCWKSLKDDLRCAHRHRNNPGTMNGTYGFRCAADVEVR